MKRNMRRTGLRGLVVAAAFVVACVSLLTEFLSRESKAAAAAVPPGSMSLTVLDVGQGSGALLRAGKTALIDAGDREYGRAVCDALRALGVERLELVVLTHPHADHYGGMLAVLEEFPVDTFVLPQVSPELTPTNSSYLNLLKLLEENGCAVVAAQMPLEYDLSGATLRILGPFPAQPASLNDTSLCMRADCGEASFLITGDGEVAVEDALRESGAFIGADILVAGHHGSNTSSKQYFLNAVRPKASAISCGIGNSYGFPHRQTVERLAAFGAVYRTDLNGELQFLTDGETIRVSAGGIDDSIDAKG